MLINIENFSLQVLASGYWSIYHLMFINVIKENANPKKEHER